MQRHRRHLQSTITVDGPAASGKGAVASLLAQRLGRVHLDTGALFRAVGYLSGQFPDVSAVSIASGLCLDRGGAVVYDGGVVPDEKLRSEEVARLASRVSQNPSVRAALKKLIRSEAARHPCVVEGRDCGSVLVSEADRKFFLTADVVERARRRQRQLEAPSFEAVVDDIVCRDLADARFFSKIPKDTVVVDGTWLSVQETVELVLRELQSPTANRIG